jgi:hypothetical protein
MRDGFPNGAKEMRTLGKLWTSRATGQLEKGQGPARSALARAFSEHGQYWLDLAGPPPLSAPDDGDQFIGR